MHLGRSDATIISANALRVCKLLCFTSFSILHHFDLLSKMLLTDFRQLRFPCKIFPDFVLEVRNSGPAPLSAPFPYTCPKYQTFLGKSPVILRSPQTGLQIRTRLQSRVSYKTGATIYQATSYEANLDFFIRLS